MTGSRRSVVYEQTEAALEGGPVVAAMRALFVTRSSFDGSLVGAAGQEEERQRQSRRGGAQERSRKGRKHQLSLSRSQSERAHAATGADAR